MRFDDLLVRDVEELHQEIAAREGTATLMDALGSLDRVEVPHSAVAGPAGCSQDWPAWELRACREHAELGDAGSARRLAELLELTGQHIEAGAWWHRAAALGDQDAAAYLTEVAGRS